MPTDHIAGPTSTSTTKASSPTPSSGTRRWPRASPAEGIAELTDRHWQVIRFMRDAYPQGHRRRRPRRSARPPGVTVKELYQLFPKGPAKLAAKIAGIPKPRGCI